MILLVCALNAHNGSINWYKNISFFCLIQNIFQYDIDSLYHMSLIN